MGSPQAVPQAPRLKFSLPPAYSPEPTSHSTLDFQSVSKTMQIAALALPSGAQPLNTSPTLSCMISASMPAQGVSQPSHKPLKEQALLAAHQAKLQAQQQQKQAAFEATFTNPFDELRL